MASAKVRDIKIKEQTIRLRKPKTTVTKDNAKVLQFLDLVCEVDRLSDESEDVISKRLRDIIKNRIYRSRILMLIFHYTQLKYIKISTKMSYVLYLHNDYVLFKDEYLIMI